MNNNNISEKCLLNEYVQEKKYFHPIYETEQLENGFVSRVTFWIASCRYIAFSSFMPTKKLAEEDAAIWINKALGKLEALGEREPFKIDKHWKLIRDQNGMILDPKSFSHIKMDDRFLLEWDDDLFFEKEDQPSNGSTVAIKEFSIPKNVVHSVGPTRRSEKPKGGEIQLILGPMFGGKTSELLRRVDILELAERKCYLVKFDKDQRYGAGPVIVTHNGTKKSAYPHSTLPDPKECDAFDVIAVDEGQFFKGIVPFCTKLASRGKIVIVSALNGTFDQKKWDGVSDLIPVATHLTFLRAVCYVCKSMDAVYSHLIDHSLNNSEINIGGKEKYQSVCLDCHYN